MEAHEHRCHECRKVDECIAPCPEDSYAEPCGICDGYHPQKHHDKGMDCRADYGKTYGPIPTAYPYLCEECQERSA